MTNKQKSSSNDLTETTESRASFSRRLQIDAGYLTRLVHKGLPVTEDGKLVRVEAAIAWMRTNIGKPGRQPGSVNGDNGTPASEELLQARVRLVLAQAERAEYELEITKENFVDIQVVRKSVRAFSRVYRDSTLNFANRYSGQIAAELGVKPGECAAVLDYYIRDLLISVSSGEMPFGAGDDLSEYELYCEWREQREKEKSSDQ